MWTDPVIFDCIWDRLGTLDGLLNLFEDGAAGMNLVSSLVQVSSHFGHLKARIFRQLNRPYLSSIGAVAARVVVCEVTQRRMLRGIQTSFELLGIEHSCIAGGFAAWQLERYTDTKSGCDAFPRATRGVRVWDGWPRHDLWVPNDVDLFVACDDPEIALDIIGTFYNRFHNSLFSSPGITVDHTDEYQYGASDPPSADDISRIARQYNLPEGVIARCRMHRQCIYRPRRLPIRSTWRFSSHHRENIFPVCLNVIFTSHPSVLPFREWITGHFDLRHCCIECAVADDGTYTFRTSNVAFEALRHRRIEFTPATFADPACHKSIVRIGRYMSQGFTMTGDDNVCPIRGDLTSISFDPM